MALNDLYRPGCLCYNPKPIIGFFFLVFMQFLRSHFRMVNPAAQGSQLHIPYIRVHKGLKTIYKGVAQCSSEGIVHLVGPFSHHPLEDRPPQIPWM